MLELGREEWWAGGPLGVAVGRLPGSSSKSVAAPRSDSFTSSADSLPRPSLLLPPVAVVGPVGRCSDPRLPPVFQTCGLARAACNEPCLPRSAIQWWFALSRFVDSRFGGRGEREHAIGRFSSSWCVPFYRVFFFSPSLFVRCCLKTRFLSESTPLLRC